jgi:hypothetical protein
MSKRPPMSAEVAKAARIEPRSEMAVLRMQ